VFVNCSGSAIAMPGLAEQLPAILQAWYPGEQGGRAVAEVLFGDVNPGGRLPITFYRSSDDLPAFDDYSMSNRTYRFFNGQPLFAFGHGLSYTKFAYNGAKIDRDTVGPAGSVRLAVKVENSGSRDGDEVAQVYVRQRTASVATPVKALKGFARVHLKAGETQTVTLRLKQSELAVWGASQEWKVEPGEYTITAGGSSAANLAANITLK